MEKKGEKTCLELQKVDVTPSYLSPLKAALNLARDASMNTVTYNDSCPRVTPKAYIALGPGRNGGRAPLVSRGIKAEAGTPPLQVVHVQRPRRRRRASRCH